jgi:UDP:flavonoid glycosyltransferase YjiC (YdhE family)
MATILFTWELGRGLGHMLPMRPMVEGLVKAGHTVYLALRHLHTAAPVLGHTGALFLQAPYHPGNMRFPRTLSVAQVLANCGWGSYPELFGVACGWRNLVRLVKPDLIVFDHSPTAMLASLGLPGVKRIVTGNGFLVPPDVRPLPVFREHDARRGGEDLLAAEQRLAQVEGQMLDIANAVLSPWRPKQPLQRLGQLWSEVDETFLATYPELDHYPVRENGRYWGTISGAAGGKPVKWPDGPGRRIFAYVRPCDALPHLLGALRDRGDNVVVYGDSIDAPVKREYQTDRLVFVDERVDMQQVARECDAAVHHGNHGTVSDLLLAGKPMLSLPMYLEQTLTARAVAKIGAGKHASAECKSGWVSQQAEEVRRKLNEVVEDPECTEAARRFAAKYADFNPKKQQEEMLRRTLELLPAKAAPAAVAPARLGPQTLTLLPAAAPARAPAHSLFRS